MSRSGATSCPEEPRERLLFREVIDTVDPDFARAFALYERSFPPSERAPRDYFVVALEAKRGGKLSPDNFRFLVCRRGEEVIGLCTGRFIESMRVGFIGYLVVDPARRNEQIGSLMRRHVLRGFRNDAKLAGHEDLEALIGEVEPTNPWIANLVRKGKVLALDVDYRQPAITPANTMVPLVLYYQVVSSDTVPRALPTEKVEAFVIAIYQKVYRIPDPRPTEAFRVFVRSVAGRTEIGPINLEAARRRALRSEPKPGTGSTTDAPRTRNSEPG